MSKISIIKKSIYNNLSSLISSRINFLVIFCCVLSTCFWMVYSAKYYYFQSGGGIDAALHNQTIWSLSQGSAYNSIIGTSFLAEHCTLISFVLAPIYKIFPDPLFLQNIKFFAFFAGCFIFFLILKEKIHPWIAFLGVVLYSVNPSNLAMLRGNFNYEPLAIPLFFLIFYFFEKRNYLMYLIGCFCLTLIKEQMTLVVMMFGVYAFFSTKNQRMRWAGIPFLLGLGMFILEVFVIIPYIRKDLPVQQSYYWGRFALYGQTPLEIILFLLTHPYKLIESFSEEFNVRWVSNLFLPWGWISFLSPKVLIVALPLFLKNLISSSIYEKMVAANYYAATFMPFIFLGNWLAIIRIKNKLRLIACIAVLLMMAFQSIDYIKSNYSNLIIDQNKIFPPSAILNRISKDISPRAGVLVDDYFLHHMSTRAKTYPLRSFIKGKYDISDVKFVLKNEIKYILFYNYNAYIYLNPQFAEYKNNFYKATNLNFNNQWRLKEAIGDVALYERNYLNQNPKRLVDRSTKPFIENNSYARNYENKIELNEIDYPKVFPNQYRIFPVTMYWKSINYSPTYYQIITSLSKDRKNYYDNLRLIGSTIYPTALWKKGEFIKEEYFYLFTRLSAGKYSMVFIVKNASTHKQVDSFEISFIVP